MPRHARIDIPGQLYHVMSRGIERGKIFLDEADCADFVERFALGLKVAGGKCLAWSLMPNHFHFLVLRGPRPLSEMMHRVMTGYAVNFNLRHRRAGHLFQNRYKAIICDAEEYLLELVPYIHLNPLRAKIVQDLAGLEGYKWGGHAAVITGVPDEILDMSALLSHFGVDEGTAKEKYKALMAEKAAGDAPINYSGGGLVRSFKGIGDILAALRAGGKELSDPRILGTGDFVESVLRTAGAAEERVLKSRGEVLGEVEKLTGIPREELFRPSHEHGPARARAVYCYFCKENTGASGPELMRELGVTQSGVSRLIKKGREIVKRSELVI